MCVHSEPGCGMLTSVRAHSGDPAAAKADSFDPHLVATSYTGGVYVFTVVPDTGGEVVTLKCLNMVPPVDEADDV